MLSKYQVVSFYEKVIKVKAAYRAI